VSDISPSAIKVTPALEEALKNADASQIATIMQQARLDQNLVRPDWDPSFLIPVEQTATQPRRFAKTEEIAGKKIVFEGDSEIEVERQIGAAYKVAATLQPTETQQTIEQPRNERGQFVAAEQTVSDEQKAALQLQFQLGQIDVETYLDKSGAIEKHIERREQAARTTGWESATESFLQSAEGASWPGGSEALARIGQIIQDSGLVDTFDKLDALKQAYALMQQEESEVTAREKLSEASQRISEATSAEEIMEVLRPNGSGIFGR